MSTGNIIGGIVGAVAGFFVGGPAGAAVGFGLGMGIGGMLDPMPGMKIDGPRLNDLSVQTSTFGAPIPRIYGTVGISGNLLWLEKNRLKEVVTRKKQGGKGGGKKTTITTYSYYATFALGLCEGPIAGVRRIWCGDKLIYNAGSADLETIIASNKAAKNFRIYFGTDNQQPDARYQADVGVANASAFRGLAYIVFYDFALKDYSNTLQAAQFKVEVVGVASFLGMREIVNAQSGIVYSGSVGPYIYSINGGAQLSAGSAAYRHRLDGRGAPLGPAGQDDLLPAASGNKRYCGHLANGGKLWARESNETYVDGRDIGVTESNLGVTADIPISLASAGVDVAGKKVNGVSVSTNGRYLAVSLIPDDASVTSANISTVHLLTHDLELISSHVTDEPIAFTRPLALGRRAENHAGRTSYTASCISNDGKFLYAAYGAYERSIERWIFEPGVMRLTDEFKLALSSGGSFTRPGIAEQDGVVYVAAGTGFYVWVTSELTTPDRPALSSVVRGEVARSGLIDAADIDVASLSASVRGYRIAGGPIRAALEQLQMAFPFDVIQSGYQIKCVPRGGASVAAIPWEDMGAADGAQLGDVFKEQREMDTQLPRKVSIKYLDAGREYGISEQYAERLNTASVNKQDRELSLVLTADEAAGIAEVHTFGPWLERTEGTFSLPPRYLNLEPADVVTLSLRDAALEVRLVEINRTPSGRLECKVRPSRAALYNANARGGEVAGPSGTIALAGPMLWLPLDIPVVDETVQDAPGFVSAAAGYTNSWPGGVVYRTADSGQTWEDLQAYTGSAPIGTARGALLASNGTLIDERTLRVDLISGELESITRDQMLSGRNYAAYGKDGRWEVVRFREAALQADGSYVLQGFLRGERGTEWATGLHQAGDWFVLLDDADSAFITVSTESIGLSKRYRGITAGEGIDDGDDVDFTYHGVNLECLSPVYAKGSRNGAGDLSVGWTRRSRISSSWWSNGVVTPLGEASESYEIDVLSGSTVKRTLASAMPAITYTAADQLADFASAQASVKLRIYQLSAVVGRGAYLEVTL